MLAKRTYKNQVTIPKEVIHQIGDAVYFDVTCHDGEIILRPVDITGKKDRLLKIREKIKKLGLTENGIDEAIRWARSRLRKS